MLEAFDRLEKVAPTDTTVLIAGESGTGKELLARSIHEHSGRDGRFGGVNLAALPETIVESELFGHEKGAFTGATNKREGRIAQAHRGTLFLDEIGELSPQVQVKLLRVLQEGEYEPVGGTTQKAEFRLIAATNRNLQQAVEEGTFREDLYYRLNVIAITSPRLSSRRDDVPLLTDHFLELYCRKNGKARMSVTPDALELLMSYGWPGNVRELENVIERAVVLSTGEILDDELLPSTITEPSSQTHPRVELPRNGFSLKDAVSAYERQLIVKALESSGGVQKRAAELLRVKPTTLHEMMKRLEISPEKA